MLRALLRVLIYALPLILWLLLAALAATELGSYARTWDALHAIFNTLEPGYENKDVNILSFYQLTALTRKLAHVVVYSVVVLLTVRLCQVGRPRLRPLSLVLAFLVSIAFLAVEVYLRLNQSEGTRHVRLEQFILDGIGVGLVMLGTPAYFGLKSLERWLLEESSSPVTTAEPASDASPRLSVQPRQ